MAKDEKNPTVLIISAVTLAIITVILFLSILKNKVPSSPPVALEKTNVEFTERIFDFGRAKEGEKIEHTFKFRNIGQSKLVVESVFAPCGCTAVVISEKTIASGGEGEIRASLNTAGYRGFVSKNIYIDSNAPPIQLKIEGVVETALFVVPSKIDFETLKKGVQENRKIYISKGGNKDLQILRAKSSSEYLTVQTREIEQKPPNEYTKKFEVEVAPDMPVGLINETMTIYTNDENYSKTEVPVVGNIRFSSQENPSLSEPSILFFPPLFFFGSVKQGETPAQKINIQTTGSEPLKIEKIENYMDEFISIKVSPKIENKEYDIIASLKDNVPTGKIEGFIVIYTNNPSKPRMEIPVNIFVEK